MNSDSRKKYKILTFERSYQIDLLHIDAIFLSVIVLFFFIELAKKHPSFFSLLNRSTAQCNSIDQCHFVPGTLALVYNFIKWLDISFHSHLHISSGAVCRWRCDNQFLCLYVFYFLLLSYLPSIE